MTVPGRPTVEVDFIAPRHLAGAGDPAWITVPLHRACGWSHGNDPLMPRGVLSSSDQKALLRLEPDPDGQWWTLHHAQEPGRPAWYATFGARTPVELIAAVTDALTDPVPRPKAPSDPYGWLRRADWPDHGDDGFVSPAATAFVQRTGSPEDPGAWFVTAALGPDRPIWQARFSEHAPPHLITAFTRALANPKPVLRTDGPRALATRDPHLVTRTTTEVLAVYVAGALEERVRRLAGRSAPAPAPLPTDRARRADRGRAR